jgi:oxidoreductase
VNTAKVAHESGCKRFSIVTAENANKDSFFLYPQTKGLVEQHVSEIPFEKLTIARPGFISHRTQARLVEKIALGVLKPITWMKPTLITIPTTKIAKGMIYNMCSDPVADEKKIEILNNAKLHEISDNFYDKVFPSNKTQ